MDRRSYRDRHPFLHWAFGEDRPWKFWRPTSGVVGGFVAGVVFMAIVVLARIAWALIR